ncbi:MAG: prohibitin family protein [bacterium]
MSTRQEDIYEVKRKVGRFKNIGIILGIILLFLLFVLPLINPLVIVDTGKRGVVLNFGAVSERVLNEGLHFRIPVMQRVIMVDVRVNKEQTNAEAASKDLQQTHSVIALNYHILPDKAWKVYQRIGTEFKERIIDPAVQEGVKAVTARYTAVELITEREKVGREIKDLLKRKLLPYDIGVDEFSIVNFQFSQQFTEAIESKQTAEQLALKAQRDLQRIKIEAEQQITQARAEAEALRLKRENITDDLIRLRQIEANLKAIEKWDGRMPQITGGVLPFIDVKSLQR